MHLLEKEENMTTKYIYFPVLVLFVLILFGFVNVPVNHASPSNPASVNCASSEVPQLECEALVIFYNSTNGFNWTNNTNWLTISSSVDVCDWYGVTCSGNNVIYLQLADNQLSGSIPAHIGNLTNLTYIYLSNNQLSGEIPAQIGNLTNLGSLLLSQNQLSGGIPAQIGNLTNLTQLYLGSNQLSGGIPATLGNLSSLTTLTIEGNSITSWPDTFANLTGVSYLYMVGVCEPPSSTLQAWMNGIATVVGRDGNYCDDMGEPPALCAENHICLFDGSSFTALDTNGELSIDSAGYVSGDIIYLNLVYTGNVVDFQNKLTSIVNNSDFALTIGFNNGNNVSLDPGGQDDFTATANDDQAYYIRLQESSVPPTVTTCEPSDLAGLSTSALWSAYEDANWECALTIIGVLEGRIGVNAVKNQLESYLANISNSADFLSKVVYTIDNSYVGCHTDSVQFLDELANIMTNDTTFEAYGSNTRWRATYLWMRIVNRKGNLSNTDMNTLTQMLHDPDPNLVSITAFLLEGFVLYRYHSPACPLAITPIQVNTIYAELQDAYQNNTYMSEATAVKILEANIYLGSVLDYFEDCDPSLPNAQNWEENAHAIFINQTLQPAQTCPTLIAGANVSIRMPRNPESSLGSASITTVCGKLQELYNSYAQLGIQYASDDNHTNVMVIIFGNSTEFGTYGGSIPGFPTRAGGVYYDNYAETQISGGITNVLFTYDRTSSAYAFSLEHLLKHEFAHYLANRFNFHGFWSQYAVDNAVYDEGLAEYLAFHSAGISDPDPTYRSGLCQYDPNDLALSDLLYLGSFSNQTVEPLQSVLYQASYSFIYHLYNDQPANFADIYYAHLLQTYDFNGTSVQTPAGAIPISSWDWHGMLGGNQWCGTSPDPLAVDDHGDSAGSASAVSLNNEQARMVLNDGSDTDSFQLSSAQDQSFIVRVDLPPNATTSFNIEIRDDLGNLIVDDVHTGTRSASLSDNRYFTPISGQAGRTYYVDVRLAGSSQTALLDLSGGVPITGDEFDAIGGVSVPTAVFLSDISTNNVPLTSIILTLFMLTMITTHHLRRR